jgi:hypothetical protein
MKYVVKFEPVESWKSPYNGAELDAIGSHQAEPAVIKVASERQHFEIMSTLIHEYAHAVQYFSLGSKFHTNYSAEAATKQHIENVYENEASDLSNRLRLARHKTREFNSAFIDFKFEFPPEPKPIPKPTLRKVCHDEWYYYDNEESTHWSDTRAFKCNRNKWWLRR